MITWLMPFYRQHPLDRHVRGILEAYKRSSRSYAPGIATWSELGLAITIDHRETRSL